MVFGWFLVVLCFLAVGEFPITSFDFKKKQSVLLLCFSPWWTGNRRAKGRSFLNHGVLH